MSVSQTLKDVKELLGNEGENWTQRAPARSAEGEMVLIHDPRAVCWCLAGAIEEVLPLPEGLKFAADYHPTWDHLRDQVSDYEEKSFVIFNDTHEWPEVSALLDRAIAEAERQEL